VVLDLVAIVILSVMIAIGAVWNAILSVVQAFGVNVGGAMMNLGEMGNQLATAVNALPGLLTGTDQNAQSQTNAAIAAGAFTAAADQATASLTNLPQGYRIAQAEWENMGGGPPGGGMNGPSVGGGGTNYFGSGNSSSVGASSDVGTGQVTGSSPNPTGATPRGSGATDSADWVKNGGGHGGQEGRGGGSSSDGSSSGAGSSSSSGGSSSSSGGSNYNGSDNKSGKGGSGHRQYSEGGIASSPQFASIAEGGGPEAVLPPDLTALLLRAAGKGGGGQSIVINATIVTNDPKVLWDRFQAYAKKASMAAMGRALPGGPRYMTPHDAR
jgi:hypothetical protein